MQENYRISILGRQIVDGQPEEVELTTFGQYTIKNGKRYIMYREYEEGEPASAVAKRLSQKYSRRKRDVYAMVLDMQ